MMTNTKNKTSPVAILALVVIAGILIGLCPCSFSCSSERAKRTACINNLSAMGKVMKLYSMDHGEKYPSSFASMTNYMENPKLYVCPCSGKKTGVIETSDQWADYILVTNLTEKSPSVHVHAYCKPDNHREHHGINVLFVDGSVQWVRESDFNTLACDVLKGSRINNREAQPPPKTSSQSSQFRE